MGRLAQPWQRQLFDEAMKTRICEHEWVMQPDPNFEATRRRSLGALLQHEGWLDDWDSDDMFGLVRMGSIAVNMAGLLIEINKKEYEYFISADCCF